MHKHAHITLEDIFFLMAEPRKKKQRLGEGEPIMIYDRPTIGRLHYLLWIARLCCLHACELLISLKEEGECNEKEGEKVLSTALLSRKYIYSLRKLSQKTTVPLSTSVKNHFCKVCSLFMYNGLTCNNSLRLDGVNCFYTRVCYGCGNEKRKVIKLKGKDIESLWVQSEYSGR
jgi:RNase P subunit RPR2